MLLSGFIFGLLGSFHCIGMCGPIAFMLPVDRTNKTKQFFQIFSYHFGRIFTYSLIGLLFGLLGKGISIFGYQQQLSIFAGVFIILITLLPNLFKKINAANKISLVILKVKSALGKELKRKGNDTFFVVGFLNGFLPCGLVYMAVLGALATSSTLNGVLYMALFGLGTVPLMTAFVYLGNFTNNNWKSKIRKIIPVAVVFIGVLFILRGLELGIPFVSPKPVLEVVDATQVCN